MKLRVEVVWENEGEEQRSKVVMAIERPQLAMETLGLNLAESKAMLEGVQGIVVAQQVAEDLSSGAGACIAERGIAAKAVARRK